MSAQETHPPEPEVYVATAHCSSAVAGSAIASGTVGVFRRGSQHRFARLSLQGILNASSLLDIPPLRDLDGISRRPDDAGCRRATFTVWAQNAWLLSSPGCKLGVG
jgi:hypothetical protein